MTPSEFWEGNVYLAEAYRKAYRLRMKRQNELMYVQGVYIYQAFSTVMSNFHLDGKKHKTNHYLEKPLDYFLTQEEVDERKRQKEEADKQKLVAYLTGLQTSWEKKQKKGTENGTKN